MQLVQTTDQTNTSIIMSQVGKFTAQKNIVNAILMHSVAAPIVFVGFHVLYDCPMEGLSPITFPLTESLQSVGSLSELTCRVGLFHPIIFVNIVMFFFVCVLFWLLSILQKSTWLIGTSSFHFFSHYFFFLFFYSLCVLYIESIFLLSSAFYAL